MTKNRLKSWAILAVGLFWVGTTQAQESVNSAGGDAIGSGGTVAYSLGQLVYTQNVGSTGSFAQGVQQTYEISTVAIRETELDIVITVFPNPTVDKLSLEVSDYGKVALHYLLYDMQGKLLGTGQIEAQQTIIEMSNLPAATYFVNVLDQENLAIQSIKIIKTD